MDKTATLIGIHLVNGWKYMIGKHWPEGRLEDRGDCWAFYEGPFDMSDNKDAGHIIIIPKTAVSGIIYELK